MKLWDDWVRRSDDIDREIEEYDKALADLTASREEFESSVRKAFENVTLLDRSVEALAYGQPDFVQRRRIIAELSGSRDNIEPSMFCCVMPSQLKPQANKFFAPVFLLMDDEEIGVGPQQAGLCPWGTSKERVDRWLERLRALLHECDEVQVGILRRYVEIYVHLHPDEYRQCWELYWLNKSFSGELADDDSN